MAFGQGVLGSGLRLGSCIPSPGLCVHRLGARRSRGNNRCRKHSVQRSHETNWYVRTGGNICTPWRPRRQLVEATCSLPHLKGIACSTAQRRLTPRSSGAPTAGHQARAGGTPHIFTGPGLASYRCRPLSSNVRQMQKCHLAQAVPIAGQPHSAARPIGPHAPVRLGPVKRTAWHVSFETSSLRPTWV